MKWNKYPEVLPDKKHIKLKTQFLIKGFYKVGDSKGGTHYKVSRLVSYLGDAVVLFEEPQYFNTLEWSYIS